VRRQPQHRNSGSAGLTAREEWEEGLGYRFRDPELLTRALTHRSWRADQHEPTEENRDNEQLEFLGDSILGFVASEALVRLHPSAHEGSLSQWKAHLVSSSHLYLRAVELDIGAHLLLGRGEERNGGRARKTILANALEALIAAIYVDGGIEAACRFIEDHVLKGLERDIHTRQVALNNHKSTLQERAQALGLATPKYLIVATSGPEHAKTFTVEARISDELVSRASGPSKKVASQEAALLLLDQLNLL